jgi:hypothetical protein
MHTVANFEMEDASATPAEMQKHEQLMRSPEYVAEVLKSINEIANRHAQRAGHTRPVKITGSIGAVTHT